MVAAREQRRGASSAVGSVAAFQAAVVVNYRSEQLQLLSSSCA